MRRTAPPLVAVAVAGLALTASPAASAAPQEIFVPTGIVAPDGLVSGAGSVSSVEDGWPAFADVVFPAAKPLLQALADGSAVVLDSIEAGANGLPGPLRELVPAFLR